MVEAGYLVSTILMGLFLIAVARAFAGREDWRRYSDDVRSDEGTLSAVLQSPMAWLAGFLVTVFVVGTGALLYVGGGPAIPDAGRQVVGYLVAAIFAVLLAVFLVVGIYTAERHKGRSGAQGLAEGLSVLGLLFVVAILIQLVMG